MEQKQLTQLFAMICFYAMSDNKIVLEYLVNYYALTLNIAYQNARI